MRDWPMGALGNTAAHDKLDRLQWAAAHRTLAALPEWAKDEYRTGEGPLTVAGVHVAEDGTAYGDVGTGGWFGEEYGNTVRGLGSGGSQGGGIDHGAGGIDPGAAAPTHPNCRSTTTLEVPQAIAEYAKQEAVERSKRRTPNQR